MVLPPKRPAPPEASGPRLRVAMGGGDTIEIWDDCVVAGRSVFPFDEAFGARLVPDPRAPLTVDPPFALALLTHGAYWAVFVPLREEDTLHALSEIRVACHQRGIEPIGMDAAAAGLSAPTWSAAPQQPDTSVRDTPPSQHQPAPGAARFNDTESVLVAIAHFSLLFLPVLLSAAIWQALRRSNPSVAQPAKEAAAFQGVFCAIALPLLGVTFGMAHAYGFVAASAIGLACFFVLLLAAASCVFAAGMRALRGYPFNYRGVLPRRRPAVYPYA